MKRSKLKKGDRIKIIGRTFRNSDKLLPEEFEQEHIVERKETSRWSGDEFVHIRLPERDGLSYWETRIMIPVRKVIKTNTKIYELKKRFLK